MTLEDFFTLSELNNGLTTPSRVRELVAIMETETDSSGKNIGDVTRQWSTVAGAISATEDKDCRDLFVQIHGLNCIAKWLNHAQKLVNEESDGSIEETITHLLEAVETFHVDHETLIASEIWTTVKDLLAHNSPQVNNRARALFGKWENKVESNVSLLDNDKSGALNNNEAGEIQDVKEGSEHPESSLGNTHPSQETSAEEEKVNELTRGETLLSATNDVVEDGEDALVNNLGNKLDPIEPEKSTIGLPHSTATTPVESCSPSVPNIESSLVELPSREESKPPEGTSVAEIGSKNSCDENAYIGLTIAPDEKCPINGTGDAKECDGQTMSHKPSSSENKWENLKDFRSFPMGIEVDGKANRRGLLTSGCDLANSYGLGKKHTDREDAAKSGNEPDYGIVDPLEVARQVAIEVEREVVDYREQSHNGSEKSPKDRPDSPESVRGEKFIMSDDDSPDGSEEYSKMQEDSSSENSDEEQRNETQDMAISPQVTEAANTEINTEKVSCGFDLNQLSSEDVEDNHASPVSTPVSMVSASTATAAPRLPTVPFQFEGNLGWKGTAATSAFRVASPHRVPENTRELHAGESSGSKKAEPFLGLDLNVADNADPRESLPDMNSRESEHLGLDLNDVGESGSGGPQDWLFGKLHPRQNVSHSSSSSKQPVSFIDLNDQPSFLNNSDISDPQTFDALGGSKSNELTIFGAKFEKGRGFGSSKSNELTIFGTKFERGRDKVPHTMSLSNGLTPELAFDAADVGPTGSFFGIAPPMIQYTNDSVYGYNNTRSGQAMPLSSSMYGSAGPIPYMVHSRGAPVIPQIVGSSSAFQNPFPQPPFVMNLSTSNPSNGAGPSRSSFDLNSGSMVESNSQDTSSFGPFLNLGQLRSMDEQLRSNSQPTVGPKRKEPEDGWEDYGFIPYTPAWK